MFMNDKITATLMQSDLANSVCVKIPVNGLEVSIAIDDSITKSNQLFRGDIRIFKGQFVEDDITSECFRETTVMATTENLMKAIEFCQLRGND